jgi:hypothetical protein
MDAMCLRAPYRFRKFRVIAVERMVRYIKEPKTTS